MSYSRRQLYFAEALALHLQKRGLDVWFDLQQLRAGTVWSDGLTDGVRDADRLVLVVSQAALSSPWTQAEWKGMAGKGGQLILAVFEPVELPEELRGLPTFDFRTAFDEPVLALAAYLDGRGEARHDPIPAPNRLALPLSLPASVWLVLLALCAPLIAGLLALPIAGVPQEEDAVNWGFFAFFAACAVAIAGAQALPFWRRTIAYKGLKRGLFWGGWLCLATMILLAIIASGAIWIFALAWILILFVHLVWIRRSASLLRWMQADEGLQGLRRRVHRPLMQASVADSQLVEQPAGPAFSFELHFDAADAPLARRIESILRAKGHRRAAAGEQPEHHIAVLSNRSSQPWIESLTQTWAGRLVCVLASTIEPGDRLKQTARYQWVDFRGGDRADIETLARSLSDPAGAGREAGLEATPDLFEHWKVPAGIGLLRTVAEWFGAFILIFGASDVIGAGLGWLWPRVFRPNEDGDAARSSLLVVLGIGLIWLAGKALVFRRIPATPMYGLLVAAVVGVGLLADVLPRGLRCYPWVPLALFLPFVLLSWLDGRHWLPAFAPVHADEVGIKRAEERKFHRRNIVKVVVWVTLIVTLAIGSAMTVDAGGPDQAPEPCKES